MNKKITQLLTDGLLHGYAGKSPIEQIDRNGFVGKATHYVGNGTYHDEWFANYLGGGQELVEIDGAKFTRLYAGGTSLPEVLQKLEINKNDVGKYLIKKILELRNATRLFADCSPTSDGDWKYEYKVVAVHEEIGMIYTTEKITYKDKVVHIHDFLLCQIM